MKKILKLLPQRSLEDSKRKIMYLSRYWQTGHKLTVLENKQEKIE